MRSVERCYRGSSVRVYRLDQDAVLARLRARAEEIVASRSDVIDVLLFGSLARGDATPGSDADLVVIVRDGAGPFLHRIDEMSRCFVGIGIGCDIVVLTESERSRMIAEGRRFAREALEHGLTLASRPSEDPAPAAP